MVFKVTFVEHDWKTSRVAVALVEAESGSEATKIAIDKHGWGTAHHVDAIHLAQST